MSDLDRVALVDRYRRPRGYRFAPDEWEPFRVAQQDWILTLYVQRVFQRREFQIALFLAADHYRYVKDAGVMAGLVYSLSDAYSRLGKMALHFVGPPEGYEPTVPDSIRRVAVTLGVTIPEERTYITDEEGRSLYIRLTRFSDDALKIFERSGIDPIQACFVVQRKVWTRDQVEFLLRVCSEPGRVFSGGAAPERRLSFQRDLLALRLALLSERVLTALQMAAGDENAAAVGRWRRENIKEYRAHKNLSVAVEQQPPMHVSAGETLTVLLAPLPRFVPPWLPLRDILAAGVLPPPALVAVTKDFAWAPANLQTEIVAACHPHGCGVLTTVDTLTESDYEIGLRLNRSVSTRHAVPERQD